jgi:SNF2 family DNA or RNA helicase
MLPRQPLRFLLADDPGAGKTIMAGLLIKELLIRGDLERCLIVAPGGLVEQWQEEMADKFSLSFDILSRDQIETSLTGNPFMERNRLICRLDMAARSGCIARNQWVSGSLVSAITVPEVTDQRWLQRVQPTRRP